MTHYRVAWQAEQASTWQWKSTVLSSLETLFGWLRMYRALPQERLRVFCSPSREELGEQLAREDQGLGSTSVTAAHFLQERAIAVPAVAKEEPAEVTPRYRGAAARVVATPPSQDGRSKGGSALHEPGLRALEWKREEFERGTGGDHDTQYRFTLPTSMPQVLAWVKLLVRVHDGELQP